MEVILMFKDGTHKFMTTPKGGYGGFIRYAVPEQPILTSWELSGGLPNDPFLVLNFRVTQETVLGPNGRAAVYREES